MAERKTSIETLSRKYLCDEVAYYIKKSIFNLELPRGTRLYVDNLANELNVSITPVREALRTLVGEGLVVYSGKGYKVFNPSKKEIEDIFNIRRMLERLAASLAAKNMDQKVLDYLLDLYSKDVQPNYLKSQSEFIRADKIFHAQILESSENNRLVQMLATVSEQSWFIRACCYSHVFPSSYVEQTNFEHLEILKAIENRDEKKAEEAMEKHIVHGEQRTWEAIEGSKLNFPSFD